jgi:flagella basal body P-ring formation protein FlgA
MKNTQINAAGYVKAITLLVVMLSPWTVVDLSVVWGQETLSIMVREDSWVKGNKVYLRDVAIIQGAPALQKRLGMIHLAFAPGPGKDKTLQGSWIASKIRSDKWLPENTSLKIPEYIRVRRTSQFIDNDTLFRFYADYIATKLENQGSDYKILRFKVIGNGPLPEGDWEIDMMNRNNNDLMGYVSLSAIVRVNEKQERRLVLSGWIDRFEEVVCTAGPLERGTILTEADLRLERRNVSKLPADVMTSLEFLVGKRLKRAAKAGTVLLAHRVEVPPLINKGDRVTIVAESDSLLITAVGVAKEKGSAGEQILVKNLLNNKEIAASVVDSGTVKVHF